MSGLLLFKAWTIDTKAKKKFSIKKKKKMKNRVGLKRKKNPPETNYLSITPVDILNEILIIDTGSGVLLRTFNFQTSCTSIIS